MPPPASVDAFLELLRNSKLLDEQQLGGFADRNQCATLPATPKETADQLVRDGLITPFQAQQLLAGKKGFHLGGHYKVLRPIGKGGHGTVFLCEHTSLHRLAAVKVLAKEKSRDKLAIERFQREARAAAALDHPNIVRVYDVLSSPKLAALVMEYVEGKNFEVLLEEAGPLPYANAVGYAIQVAAGLAHAHERGIIHRDIKPANLLVDSGGIVKILDMGLARFLSREDRLTQLMDGQVIGTADFMSPEQCSAGSPIDARTDIYSLGVTLYALITGRTPFEGSPAQKMLGHMLGNATPVALLRPEVPPALSDVVSRMMAKDPQSRYGSASDLIEALTRFNQGSAPDTAAVDSAITPTKSLRPVKLPTRPRQRSWLIAATVAALILLLLLAWQRLSLPVSAVASTVVRSLPPENTTTRSEKVRYRLQLDSIEPFRVRIENRLPDVEPVFPAGWTGHCWKEDSVAEVLVERVNGSMALGFRNLSGEPTCQLCLNLESAIGKLEEDRRYVVRVEYRAERDANAAVFVRRNDFSHFTSAKLRDTSSQWHTVELVIEPEHAAIAYDVAFCTTVNGAESTIHVRSFAVVELDD